ncbi:MAG TPA: acetate--CoA ligase family protein [Burkholderiales bacterium]|nr:acetate--CoA ligase family protein [Burkholderiales bacterium]
MTERLAQALFRPRAVALVGASGDPAKNTARPQRFLKAHGYAGRVIPVNPTRSEVLGARAYPSVAEAPEGIEHAFIMAPGDAVERALEDCGARGIPVLSVYSDGFADAGPEGAARQARLVARARELGVRVLGPNSMGIVDVPGRVALTVNAVLEIESLPTGTTSVVSQSGTMLGTVLSRGAARGLGFSKLVSVGNEADLGVGELVDLLADDPETQVILLFLETVRDAERLAAAARRAQALGRAVVAYKLGRSRLGEALARSHTGALAGSDAALDAYFRDCGILRVDMLETLVEIAPLVAGRAAPDLSHRPRIAVVTTTGGGAASVVDRMGTLGIEALEENAELRERLTALGVRVSDSPIVDLTMAATAEQYSAVLAALLESRACDGVLAVVGSSAQFHPRLAIEPILQARRGTKPLAAFFTPNAERSLAMLADKGIAAFRTPEACADAFAAYFRWRSPRSRAPALSPEWPASVPRTGKLNEAQALALFESLGATTAESVIAKAPDYRHALAYPVAAKVLSPAIAHKTEAGGVALGIADAGEYAVRVHELLSGVRATQPQARVEGVLVQRMVRGLAEAIVGYRHDPVVGPLVLAGAGGVLAEIYNDVAVRLAPVTESEASAMIAEVKGLSLIRGYRNLPKGDVGALARAIAAISRLALVEAQPVLEAEMNPVIVRRDGAVAVDGLVVFRE